MAKIFRFLASNVFKFWPKNRLQLHSLSHELAFVLSISHRGRGGRFNRGRFNNLHFLLLAVSNFAHSKLLFPRRKRKKQTNLEKNGNGQTKEWKYYNIKWRWKCLQKFINFAFAQLLFNNKKKCYHSFVFVQQLNDRHISRMNLSNEYPKRKYPKRIIVKKANEASVLKSI